LNGPGAPYTGLNGERASDVVAFNCHPVLRRPCRIVTGKDYVQGVVFIRDLFRSCRRHGVFLVAIASL